MNAGVPLVRAAGRGPFRLAALAAGGTGLAGLLWRFNPATSRFFPPCPFHALTGLYCPGCGSTRALYSLVHGDVAAAWRYNALFTLTLPFVSVLAAGELMGKGWSSMLPARAIWTFFAVVVAFWIARNVPFAPFALLAPH